MTHVVTDACVKCKYTDCIEVCPVDCFYEGEYMVVIDPQECIDCGVCVFECPIDAIKPETPELLAWVERAQKYSAIWPQITKRKPALEGAREHENEKNKFEKYISDKT